jgi:hypothetical protein
MLDQVASGELIDQLWESIDSKIALPADEAAFFSAYGVVGGVGESRRNYVRLHLREKAIMCCNGACHAVLTKDASPKGVAFLSPIQIFPKERLRLAIHGYPSMELELSRCRRLGPQCYECGAVFLPGVIPPSFYARLVSHSRRK